MERLARQPEVVDDVSVALSGGKTAGELTQMTSRLSAMNRERLRQYLRLEHPEWSAERVHEELRRRIHGAG